MPQVAFVTKTGASRVFQSQQSPQNVGNEVGVGYVLRTAEGQDLGSYRSASEAQAAFARRYGLHRIESWKRQDLAGDIEHWVATGLPLDPSEIFRDNLVEWVEPDRVQGSVLLQDATAETIRTVYDLSGTDNDAQQLAPASQPTRNNADSGFNNRQSIAVDGTQFLSTPSWPTASQLSPPYVVIVVARSTVDDGGDAFVVDTAGDDLHIGGDGAGAWELVVGATTIAAVDTPPLANAAILVARVTSTLTEFRLNGASQGSAAVVPASNGTLLLGRGVDFLTGSIAAAMVAVGSYDANDPLILQAERWFQNRYR